MGKEDRFIASIASLDGAPKFLHNSFRVPDSTLSSVTGQKLTASSLLLNEKTSKRSDDTKKGEKVVDKSKNKDWTKSYETTINKRKQTDRLSGPAPDSLEAKKQKRSGAFELNKEKVSDWDTTIQSRRLAKHYDFTMEKSKQTLETIEDSCKTFKIETPLEAEVSRLLHGDKKGDEDEAEKKAFYKDHSKDLRATRKHLEEIAHARKLARKQEAKERHQSKIKSKRYRRALRKQKAEKAQSEASEQDVEKQVDLERAQARASLKHKTITKKLRFYDKKSNSKESDVRKSQNLKNSELKAKVALHKADSDSDQDDEQNSDDNDEAIKAPSMAVNTISKRINPNDFVLPVARENIDKDSDSDSDDELDTFAADMASCGSGIEVAKKEDQPRVPKVMPGWGSWSSDPQKMKKKKDKKVPKQEKKPVYKNNLVIKESKAGLASHQLPHVPFPFKNLDDCQAYLATPIGDTFMPKTTVAKQTKPKCHVKLGAYLQPDEREEV